MMFSMVSLVQSTNQFLQTACSIAAFFGNPNAACKYVTTHSVDESLYMFLKDCSGCGH